MLQFSLVSPWEGLEYRYQPIKGLVLGKVQEAKRREEGGRRKGQTGEKGGEKEMRKWRALSLSLGPGPTDPWTNQDSGQLWNWGWAGGQLPRQGWENPVEYIGGYIGGLGSVEPLQPTPKDRISVWMPSSLIVQLGNGTDWRMSTKGPFRRWNEKLAGSPLLLLELFCFIIFPCSLSSFSSILNKSA